MRPSRRRPPGLRLLAFAATLTTLLLIGLLPPTAHAAVVKSWLPPTDSLAKVAVSAKLRFQRQQGDSITGPNFDGYQVVGEMGRVMLASLGREHWSQAQALEPTLDSLGLDVEVRTDPQLNHMVFLLVRNPYKRSADAVGYIYWLRGSELRMQGAAYPSCHDCSVRFWYTGHAEQPYEALTLYRLRKDGDRLSMRLFRMEQSGILWNLVQYEGNAPDLGKSSNAVFADINRDGLPELLAYHVSEPDSFVHIASGAPQLLQEYTFTERPEGFVLHDSRDLPGPTATLNMFASFLVHKEPELARRLVLEPARLDSVMALGWGQHARRGDWNIEYGEAQAWPEWLELKIRQDTGWQRWIFHFWIKDGRWVIRNWIPVQAAAADSTTHPRLVPQAPLLPKVKKP